MVPFLSQFGPVFYYFFFQGLSSAFDFSMSKDFSINKEFPCVNFVKCTMYLHRFHIFFYGNVRLMFDFSFFQIKEKSIFSASEGGN